MKLYNQFFLSILALGLLFSCNTEQESFETFGESFERDASIISSKDLDAVFDQLDFGDTVEVIFTTKIDAVCQKKGCWMDVDLADDAVARVTFLDYGFFVPLNAAGSEATIKGKAFWKSDTVAEKRHYAEDAGENYDDADFDDNEFSPHIIATGVMIKS